MLEAEAARPCETGGVLLGYVAQDRCSYTATHIVGPRSEAVHTATRFAPNYDYQEAEIGRLYEESGRSIHYLGAWHTHPRLSDLLNKADHMTLRRIAIMESV